MKVAVALSGGVDSSVTALLMKESGNEVIGMHADLSSALVSRHYGDSSSSRTASSVEAAAETIGIPLHVVDLQDEFSSLIVDPFCEEYLRGRTPNPCVRCDALIKFDRLLSLAKSIGCEKLASGHYAVNRVSDEGRRYVARGAEITKDQSYFLYMLSQESLVDIIFPLGRMTKEEVTHLAHSRGLPSAGRAESQEICFIPDHRHGEFIALHTGTTPAPGDIVNMSGQVIGRHRGIHRYTIGQRRGLGISSPLPLYVVAIDASANRIIAGFSDDLEIAALRAGSLHYMKETDLDGLLVLAKTRSTQVPVEARLHRDGDGIIAVFAEPQTGIAPGQAAVFYNEAMEVLGGGTIERAFTGRDEIVHSEDISPEGSG
ncbi:MAG: tRNA 2-thiouridine(34) synthase MnmA [Chrysiogenales bacterium]|nr:MAG: tRNA 2-thiouridine(34) synthase MnmA [Chrysiogenales bacterium]